MGYSIQYSTKSGLGKPSLEVYLYGCDKPIPCSGCHNRELLDIPKVTSDKYAIEKELMAEIENFKKFHKQIRVSFVGGEPTAKHNIDKLCYLSNKIKSIYVDSIIIVYSWKRLDRISHEVYGSIDYGVLGEYVKELHVENQLPSSTNQIIYDFKNHSIVDNINLDK